MSNQFKTPKYITHSVGMSLLDYIEFQLRLIFGTEVNKLSKGELQVLSYFYIYPILNEAKSKIIESNVRTSAKSISNDISKFKQENILSIAEGNIVFNEAIIVSTTPNEFLITVKVLE